ncbi:hypothetical protein Fmac_029682 [Flemingia macrophylla]|uniref:Reverse transcriptase zinc-binding domain-containing protein n=1 Tax=Flemingia macrophylla TaxID=520843 RepID=A0ABD1LB08_9FABA
MLWLKNGASQFWPLVGWNKIIRPLECSGLYIREARSLELLQPSHKSESTFRFDDWLGIGPLCNLGLQVVIPTNETHHRNNLTTSAFCCRCLLDNETTLHALRDCPHSYAPFYRCMDSKGWLPELINHLEAERRLV